MTNKIYFTFSKKKKLVYGKKLIFSYNTSVCYHISHVDITLSRRVTYYCVIGDSKYVYRGHISSRFSKNPEAIASELLGNLEETFHDR